MNGPSGREDNGKQMGERRRRRIWRRRKKSPWVCVASDTAKLCADLPGGAQAEALKLRALITPTDTRTI